ncbi:hypothetical protein [Burkholderia gladioli]|uniref:hypothetical protein n=1 Tax=Burkholderia gladioli TaxID=28095 RepID=UPI001641A0B5|nr:hypothetical protein [Burkholderia gladioli]
MIRVVGHLTPDAALLGQALHPKYPLGDFTHFVSVPEVFEKAVRHHGYTIRKTDELHGGLLFANLHGVSMHQDEFLSMLWVLATPRDEGDNPLQMICGGEYANLREGDIVLFDATRLHGVIATQVGLWCVFSVYVDATVETRETE